MASRGGKLLIRLEGVDSPEKARALVGAGLWLPREALPDLAEDEVYLHDLLGFEVRDQQGTCLGSLTGFLDNGAQDILVVSGSQGELLIPFVEPILQEIEMDAATIHVDFLPAE